MSFVQYPLSFLRHFDNSPLRDVLIYLALSVILIYSCRHIALSKRQRYAGAPMAGIRPGESLENARKRYRTEARSMLLEGYSKYKGRPFYVPTLEGDKLMIPSQFVDELKNLPDEVTDAAEPVFQAFESRYTLLASRELLHRRTFRNHLYQNIDDLKAALLDETHASIHDTVGPCDEWTEVPIAKCMVQVVARMSMRAFGGLDLSRNKAWIKAAIGSTDDAILGAQKIKLWPLLLRPVIAPFIPKIPRCKRHYEVARRDHRADTRASRALASIRKTE